MVSTFSPGTTIKSGRAVPLRRTSILLGLALGLVVFVGNAVLSYRSTAAFIASSRGVLLAHQLRQDVNEVYADLRDLQRTVSDAVFQQRPNDPIFVRSHRDGIEKLDRAVAVLEEFARSGQAHARMASDIVALSRRVRTELEDQLQLCAEHHCGDAEARNGAVVKLMRDAGEVVRAAAGELEEALEQEQATARAREELARTRLVLGAVLGSALLIVAFSLVIGQTLRSDRAAKALAESEHRAKMIIDTIRDGLTYSDDRGKFEIFNPAMEEISGYTSEEANAAADFSQLIHPDPADRARALEGMCEVLETGQTVGRETVIVTKGGERKDLLVSSAVVRGQGHTYFLSTYHDVTARRQAEREREKLIQQLQSALADVKTLRGLLPICGWCKKIRDDQGYYHRIEAYITAHSEAKFTHGICPDCAKKFEDDLAHGG